MRPSALDPERWRRIDEIFDAALEREPADRDRFLDEACSGDAALRTEVAALLDAHARAGSLFDRPAGLEEAAVRAPGAPDTGGRVGPFRILREIGRGGMGVVYLAEDTRLGRYVALKALPPYLGAGRAAKRRLEAEARAVSALDHPNIATLYEIGETEEGQLYLVFAFYEGETLDRRIARGPLPVDRAIEIATGIAQGLGAAHDRRIIHRDVKPSNVLLVGNGAVKLLDFGVAKVAGEDLTGEGVRLGTVAYMSPEHTEAGGIDGRADLWSLGVVLYEMLTGTRPFRGTDPRSTFRAILHEDPEPVAARRAGVPEALDRVVGKLLSKAADGRYQSTAEVIEDLRAVQAGRSPAVAIREPPVRAAGIERIAVLPLANLTGDPGQEHLVHGVHDVLIAELGKIRALGVISRTSVMRFRETELSVPEIADALDVDAVVEGSASRDGEDLVLAVQLVAADPERHLWSETYRRGVGGVFDVAGEVARSIAAEVGVSLSPTEEDRLTEPRPVEPAAYEAFTLGQFHLERRSPEGFALAQKYLRRAIEVDPGFAPAYAVLGETLGSGIVFGLASPAEGMPVVRELVETALELDAELAAAHTSLGAVRLFGDWDWSGAEAALRRAIALDPSYPYAYFVLAEILAVQGRYGEALAAAERNSELEQFVPFAAFGPVSVLWHMREYDRAIDRAREGLEFFSDFWLGHWMLAEALAGAGLSEESIAAGETAVEVSRRTPMAVGLLGWLYAKGGRREDALGVVAELDARAESEYVASSYFAMIHACLGDHDRAFGWLERAYEERDTGLVHLDCEVGLDDLRSDPRFVDLVDRLGLDHPREVTG